jgi:hypothetical protein
MRKTVASCSDAGAACHAGAAAATAERPRSLPSCAPSQATRGELRYQRIILWMEEQTEYRRTWIQVPSDSWEEMESPSCSPVTCRM